MFGLNLSKHGGYHTHHVLFVLSTQQYTIFMFACCSPCRLVQIVLFRFRLLGFGASAVVWRSELNTVSFVFTMVHQLSLA
jgi:hypothetical protein